MGVTRPTVFLVATDNVCCLPQEWSLTKVANLKFTLDSCENQLTADLVSYFLNIIADPTHSLPFVNKIHSKQ